MRDTELYFAMHFCWDHNIFIVVKPINNNLKYRLAISRNGKEKLGTQIYGDKPSLEMIEQADANGKKKKVTIRIPSVHEQIKALYLDIYRKSCHIKPYPVNLPPSVEFETVERFSPMPGNPGMLSLQKITRQI